MHDLSAMRHAKERDKLQKDVERLREALKPFEREIDRLEREYGFDRPTHQLQTLMLPIADLLRLRAALHSKQEGEVKRRPSEISGQAYRENL